MQPREQTQNAADSRSNRRSIVPDRQTDAVRPVALPALAAAVRGVTNMKDKARDARATAMALRFEHEDTPLA